jgi:ATP-dependent DNA helicase PIF1
MSDISFFQDRAFLAPTNDIVDSLNNYILSMIPGEKKTYLSDDSPSTLDQNINSPDQILTPEFLNTVKSSVLLNHELNLKVGVPFMLLSNIDQLLGLCNGTLLIITQMGNFVLKEKIIPGNSIGQKVYIPRLILSPSPSDTKLPFTFQRKQFSIVVSFAMTINKIQGNLLKILEYIFQNPYFHTDSYMPLFHALLHVLGWRC